jgi:dihydroorotase
VHFREPGYPEKGTFYTESRAALAGGVTTVFDMPNTQPATTTLSRLREKIALVQGRAWTNYAFYFGATPHNLELIRQLNPAEVPGVKVFLASSTGDLLVTDKQLVETIVAHAPVRVLFHSESEALIQAARAAWAGQSWEEVPDLHTRVRPATACIATTQWLLELSHRYPTPLHILHITTKEEVALLRGRPPHLTAETCPVYLFYTAEDFANYRNRLKCNPALKYPEDREALWQGLREGVFSVVGTDHAPHTYAEKQASYWEAPAGVPTHPYLLPWVYTMGLERGVGIEQWVAVLAWGPARLWRLRGRGFLREGAWADMVLFDPEGETVVPPMGHPESLNKCGWSPLAGRSLRGAVEVVWVNGYLSYEKGYFRGLPRGEAVDFG